MRWWAATSSAQAAWSRATQRSTSAASPASAPAQPMAPAFFINPRGRHVAIECYTSAQVRHAKRPGRFRTRRRLSSRRRHRGEREAVVGLITVAAPGRGRGPGLDRRPAGASFRRLLAEGDRGAGGAQTSVAIEAFSGAVALQPQSMLPYLKRGDTYLHRQDWARRRARPRAGHGARSHGPAAARAAGDVALAPGDWPRRATPYRAYLATRRSRAAACSYKLGADPLPAGRPTDAGRSPRGRVAATGRAAPTPTSCSACGAGRGPATWTPRARRSSRPSSCSRREVRRALGARGSLRAAGRDARRDDASRGGGGARRRRARPP